MKLTASLGLRTLNFDIFRKWIKFYGVYHTLTLLQKSIDTSYTVLKVSIFSQLRFACILEIDFNYFCVHPINYEINFTNWNYLIYNGEAILIETLRKIVQHSTKERGQQCQCPYCFPLFWMQTLKWWFHLQIRNYEMEK